MNCCLLDVSMLYRHSFYFNGCLPNDKCNAKIKENICSCPMLSCTIIETNYNKPVLFIAKGNLTINSSYSDFVVSLQDNSNVQSL